MHLEPGTRLGPYEIVAPLGAGGMGEVYRARDSRLDRDVALKILPELFATDPDRLMRFQREAKTLASLNHPHIAQIHGIEESSGVSALVMELVEGEDLAERIARGAIPLDEALPIAQQVAEALEAAHDAGVIHRDLKPANIRVRPDGTVKVLDFGLAKMAEPPSSLSSAAPGLSPTFTSPALTQMGIVLGTAAYMAPEQAKGRTIDRSADLWAFGVVLFEMLTGRRAFPGDDIADTFAMLLKFDPAWEELPAGTPPAIRRLLRRCVEKNPKLRLRDAGSAVLEIREASSPAMVETPDVGWAPGGQRRTWGLAALLAAVVLAAAAFAAWAGASGAADPVAVHRLAITVASGDALPQGAGSILAISPDGRTLAYTVLRDRRRVILRRPLDAFEATPIAGTEGGRDPFFSHDGQWVGFTLDGILKKVPASGGAPVSLAELPSNIRGADWLPDGRIILGQNGPAGLLEVRDGGGPITTLFKPEAGRVWFPQALPDGRTVLFTLVGPPRPNAVAGGEALAVGELRLLDRASGETRLVMENALAGRLLAGGFLLFIRDDALWAARFDADRLEVLGSPTPVVQSVRVEAGRATQLAVASNGTLVYVAGGGSGVSQKRLVWVTRAEQQEILRAPPRNYIGLRLSPDAARAAVQVVGNEGADLWVTELALGTLTRISDTGRAEHPLWSTDGRRLVFSSHVDNQWRLVIRAADGTGNVEVITSFDDSIGRVQATGWLPDGSLVVETETKSDEGDIGIVSATGDRIWRPVIRTPRFEGQSALSPDGQWLAYASDESGETQVYVQPFPGPGVRQQVPGPGWAPTWSRGGKELVYLRGGPPTDVMRVDVTPDPAAGRLAIGTPEPLATYVFYDRRTMTRFYDLPASGDRLLFISRSDELSDDERHLRVVVNWAEDLRRLLAK
jgi:serine/threonine-protein kinase